MTFHTSDINELNHFKKLSPQWWETSGPFEQLHAITPLRVKFLKEKISLHFKLSEEERTPFKGLRILDVGCGGGLLCEPLARLGAEVTGIDPVQENIDIAKAHAEEMGLFVSYLSCGIEDLPQDFPSFDVIVASEIIEHVINPQEFLEACVVRLKPHGGIFVTTFNKTLKSYLLGILVAEYVLKWAPRGTHSWDKFMSPQNLSRTLSSLGLGDQEISGLFFSPLKREWELSSSTDVNYFLWASRSR